MKRQPGKKKTKQTQIKRTSEEAGREGKRRATKREKEKAASEGLGP